MGNCVAGVVSSALYNVITAFVSLWYPCLLSCLLHLAPRASREAGVFTALGLSAFFLHARGPHLVPETQFGHGSFGCTFLVGWLWQSYARAAAELVK